MKNEKVFRDNNVIKLGETIEETLAKLVNQEVIDQETLEKIWNELVDAFGEKAINDNVLLIPENTVFVDRCGALVVSGIFEMEQEVHRKGYHEYSEHTLNTMKEIEKTIDEEIMIVFVPEEWSQ